MEGVYFTRCPVALAQGPWLIDVFRAYRHYEKGQLSLHEPHPSAALMDAVDLVATTVCEMHAYESERRREGMRK